MRSRGTQPAIASVTIRGPYDVTAPGDSPSRRRIFVCRPAAASEETVAARRQILSTLARRAYRRPVTDEDLRDLMPFYTAGRAEGSFDLGIQKSARAVARELAVPVPDRASARDRCRGQRPIASAMSSWPRGCPSSCGAAFPTMSCSSVGGRADS